jgi:ribose-phosphate pyrophosphokinase
MSFLSPAGSSVTRPQLRLADPRGEPRLRVRAGSVRGRGAAVVPVVAVLPGCGRFVSGLPPDSLARIVVKRFPNGELHLEVPDRVRQRPCVIVGSISPPAGNLARVTLVAHALRRAGAERVTAVLPYLAYARQDRAERNQSLGLAWVGELLRASGIGEVVCVDVHSDQATDLLGLPLVSLSPADLFANALPAFSGPGTTFVAPDEGAIDRASAVARAVDGDQPVVWARKRRTAAGVEHLGLVGTPGPRAIVVDDILDTGNTLVSCCAQLREAGVGRIGVVATHGLFTGDRWRALLAGGVQEIWITDAVLSRRRPPQAHVVATAPLLAAVLQGTRH